SSAPVSAVNPASFRRSTPPPSPPRGARVYHWLAMAGVTPGLRPGLTSTDTLFSGEARIGAMSTRESTGALAPIPGEPARPGFLSDADVAARVLQPGRDRPAGVAPAG